MKFNYYFFTTFIILLNSCVAYFPQVVDIPLIKEKGDVRINAGYFVVPSYSESENTWTDENEQTKELRLRTAGIHGTISAGLTDALAFQGYLNISFMSRVHLQVALGTFHAFDNKTVMELYGGWGYGNGYINKLDVRNDYYNLPFAQFNIGKSGMGKSNFDYGLGLKSGYLFCEYNNEKYATSGHNKNAWIIEPSVFFRFGGKKVKYNMMVNYLWTKAIVDDYYFPISVSMGVNFTSGNRKKKLP